MVQRAPLPGQSLGEIQIMKGIHNKAFYQLCEHMAPDYHQVEFDVRLYLTHLEHQGEPLWGAASTQA
jgi:hypothetical protein